MLMMSPRSLEPRSLAHFRASLMAVSLASAPEFEKKTRSAKEWSQRRAASCACWGIWKMLETCTRVAACSRSVPTTLGWQWPSAVTEMPPVKSRYSLPSESHTRRPSPRTRATGCRLVKVMSRVSESSIIFLVSTWRLLLEDDLRPNPLFGQDLEEDGVRDPAVDDMRLLGAARQRPERGLDLGEHASLDDLALHQALGLPLDQRRDVLAVIAHDPLHIGQMNELLGQERGGHVPGHEVGVDIVRLAPRAYSHGGDDGNEAARLEDADGLGIDALDLSHQPDVGEGAVGLTVHALSRADHGAVLAGEPHGTAAVQIDQPDDLLVDLAHQHHLDDLHRLGIGHPHPAHEFRLLAQALHEGPDLRAASVDDHRPHPDQPEEDHVAGELLLEVGLLHGRAAILDDQGLALEGADIGQRLEQHLRPLDGLRVRAHALALSLKDVAREVLVLEDGGQVGADVVGVDGHLLEQLLDPRVEPPRPDVLGALVPRGADLRHLLDGVLPEREGHALCLQ